MKNVGQLSVRAPWQLGIFAKTFSRSSFSELLEAVATHGLCCIQFNFACVGLPPMPDALAPDLLQQVRSECEARDIAIVGVSGTFNMIHPDAAQRADGLRRLEVLAPATRALGCHFISLCSGTRDAQDMWRAHPENDSPEAGRDLLVSVERALAIAEQHDVMLGIEPETGNVVSSARKARQLLDEMKSPRLKIILDPANLFRSADILSASSSAATRTRGEDVGALMRDRIDEAFQLLAPDIHLAHAKELAADGSMGGAAPGEGLMDWDFYLQCLQRMHFAGPLVLHGLPETSVARAVAFLRPRNAAILSARSSTPPPTGGPDVRAPE